MFPGQDELPDTHRRALDDAARGLIDLCMRDVVDLWHGQEPRHVIADGTVLPRRFSGLYDVDFARKFLMVLITVQWKVSAETFQLADSVAEELALDGIIRDARARVCIDGIEGLLDTFRDLAFEDLDFEWLFASEADGIEGTVAACFLGIGNLAFADWFKPFRTKGALEQK